VESEARQAAELAKPWLIRNRELLGIVALLSVLLVVTLRYSYKDRKQPSGSAAIAASENRPEPPRWAIEERSKFPRSVWVKRVAWAAQQHCYFSAMSRDEIVQVLGKPAQETAYSLTYRRQTNECVRYNGDDCSEFKTDQQFIFLKDGYDDKGLNGNSNCRTLYGEHQYLGLDIPDFKLLKANQSKENLQTAEEDSPSAEGEAAWHTKEYCEANGLAWRKETPTRCLPKKYPTESAGGNSWQTKESCESHGMFWIEIDTDHQQRGCWLHPLPDGAR